MKIIAVVAVAAVLLLQLSGITAQSSVGGPMTLMLVLMLAMLATGIHDAWSRRRGVIGALVSIITAIAGGILAAGIGGMGMDLLLSHIKLEGSLAATRHPLLYLGSAAMMLATLLGSWLALRLVDRMR